MVVRECPKQTRQARQHWAREPECVREWEHVSRASRERWDEANVPHTHGASEGYLYGDLLEHRRVCRPKGENPRQQDVYEFDVYALFQAPQAATKLVFDAHLLHTDDAPVSGRAYPLCSGA